MASTTDTNAPSGKYEKYLEDRIAETSQQVKWVELLSFFLFLTLFVLGTLFVLCLVDAWILELHVWMRWSALLLMASGSLLLAIFKAIPFLRHRINPLYAARKLEEGRPELKNSVINYLTTRAGNSRKSALAVYQKMSQRAATDVASIPQDVTVDRSRMIFAGYALAAVVAVFGLYKVLSPKDPFQTIGRVLVPSSEWMAPSRVSISELSPGNAQRYFGEQVKISARIRGLADSESGWVMITSDDGRRKDFGIRLVFDEESGLHRANLGGEKGLQESFSYRIEAGDAYTLTHRIDLRTCPTVFVESVEYQPPDYTGISGQRVENPSGISNVEGTLVRVTVRANLAMETAYLELFRTVPGGNDDPSRETENGDSETRPEKSKSVRLELGDDNTASGEFLLELNERRTGPRFTHYQAVFTSVDGDRSQNSTLSDLEVIPDLTPEVEVILPEEKIVQIPRNQLEKISVSAVDPDYGLTSIRLVVENRGNRLLEESLFQSDDALGARGRQTGSFEFRPDRYGLKEGDEVIWFVRAEDNRAAGRSQVPDPNRKRTENYKFLITSPLDAGKQENAGNQENAGEGKGDPANPNPERENRPESGNPPDREMERDPANQENSEQNRGQQQKGKEEKHSGETGEQPSQNQDGSQKKNPEQKKTGQQKQEGANSSGEPGGNSGKQKGSQKGSGTPPDQEAEGPKKEPGNRGGNSEKSRSEGGNPKGSQNQKQKGKQGSGGDSESSGNGSGGNASDGRDGDPSGRGQTSPSGDSKQSQGAPSESSGTGTDGNRNAGPGGQEGGERQPDNGSSNGSESGRGTPGDSSGRKPENSKEAFERLKDYFEKQKDRQPSGPGGNDRGNLPEEPPVKREAGGSGRPKNGKGGQEKSPGESSAGESSADRDPDSAKGRPGEPTEGDRAPDKQPSSGDGQSQGRDEKGKSGTDRQAGDSTARKDQPNGRDRSASASKVETGNAEKEKGSQGPEENGATGPKETKTKDARKKDGKGNGERERNPQSNGGGDSAEEPSRKSDSGNGKSGSQDSSSGSGKKEPEGRRAKNGSGKDSPQGQGNRETNPDAPSGNNPTRKDSSGKQRPGSEKMGDSESKDSSSGQSARERGADGNSKSSETDGKRQPGDAQRNGEAGEVNQRGKNSGGDTGQVDQADRNSRAGDRETSPRRQDGSSTGQSAQADKANLDYARKTTDMVLEKLKDQENRADRDLLKELDWTEDELREFTRRWESMRDQARSGSKKEEKRFEDALKSLGLTDPDRSVQNQELKNDGKTGYRQSAGTRKVPADFARKFRAIQKSQRKLQEK